MQIWRKIRRRLFATKVPLGKVRKIPQNCKRLESLAKWTHYPYNDPAIHDKAIDGSDSYPDFDVTKGNLATSCPKDFRLHCVGKASDNGAEEKCKCGNTKFTPSQDDCFKCELNGALPEYPLFEDYGHNTLDGLPVMTREQILERAIGWVTNGPGYNGKIQNGTGDKGAAPEGCYKGQKDCPKWGYPSVCQGMVRMAWQTQREGVSSGNALQLESCADVKPGDHIQVGGHQQIFRRWWDQSKKGNKDDWIVWQMGGGVNKANAAVWGNGKVKCTRRMKIKGETEEHHVEALREAGLLVGNILKSGFEEEMRRRAPAGAAPLLV